LIENSSISASIKDDLTTHLDIPKISLFMGLEPPEKVHPHGPKPAGVLSATRVTSSLGLPHHCEAFALLATLQDDLSLLLKEYNGLLTEHSAVQTMLIKQDSKNRDLVNQRNRLTDELVRVKNEFELEKARVFDEFRILEEENARLSDELFATRRRLELADDAQSDERVTALTSKLNKMKSSELKIKSEFMEIRNLLNHHMTDKRTSHRPLSPHNRPMYSPLPPNRPSRKSRSNTN
jgi:hypothetical protein